jgi:hypothetical protein
MSLYSITTTTTTSQPRPDVPIQPKNECDPITIFPMGVNCFTIQPTFSDSYDGVVGLGITGGTPPFTILWDDGSVAPAKFNLGAGEYTATVVDYYGDFTATTTCVLTGITTTTTTIPETTTQKVYSDYCLSLNITNLKYGFQTTNTTLTQFTYSGFYNGYPSWSASSQNLLIYWSADTINSWIVSGLTSGYITNNSYTNPSTGDPLPLTNWQLVGVNTPNTIVNSVLFTEGNCTNTNSLQINVNKNDPTCQCNGSITVAAQGGTPPYQYSINGGVTYQSTPVFQNLCGGNYSAFIKDSVGTISSQQITLAPSPSPVTYTLTLNIQYAPTNTFNITISPALPIGTTVTFDIEHLSTFIKQPPSSTQTYNNVLTLYKNSIVVPPTGSPSIVPTNIAITGPCSVYGRLKTQTTTVWQSIAMTSGDILNGTFTDNVSILTPPLPTCYGEPYKTFQILITNIRNSNGCECCNFVFVNPPQPNALSITGPFINP